MSTTTPDLPAYMACGHSTHATNGDGAPVCVICLGSHPGATQLAEPPAALTARQMRCSYRHGRDGRPCPRHDHPVASNPKAAFFAHRPDQPFDEYYCGCWGWD